MARTDLPPLIADYVRRALPGASDEARGTLIHQTGTMRLAPERDWFPFTAEQTLEATHTEFVWHARFKMAPLLTGVVEDAFEDGHGRLDAKIWGVIPLAHGRGLDIDRGEAQRYLSELVWCPTAFLHNPQLNFETTGPRTVRVWVFDERTHVDLQFDAHGDVEAAHTTTRSRGDHSQPQPWRGRFSAYRDFDGIRAPAHAEVCWEAPEGEFTYWRGDVTALELSPPEG